MKHILRKTLSIKRLQAFNHKTISAYLYPMHIKLIFYHFLNLNKHECSTLCISKVKLAMGQKDMQT